MPFRANCSLLYQKGYDKRKEDELLKSFQEADLNKDGYLSPEEYIRVFKEHGIDISRDEVLKFFSNRDKDKDGKISYDEFVGRKTLTEKAFEAMDLNSDGFISKPEMLRASQRGDKRLSSKDIEHAFEMYDQDKDNKLSYKEFCTMMNNRKGSDSQEKDIDKSKEKEEWAPQTEYGFSGLKYQQLKQT